ncbi:L-dopachrome tautomerase yellow-f2-like [Euwallacea fornicatus]|uniref:L-dopachrome tautomerase yellow-f2-like n=1 Tax=Euwallacea fornicatus TaxID=995702 RepID=UPI00338F47D0
MTNVVCCCLFMALSVILVSGKGLKEEFGWSRISYQGPEDNQLRSRAAFQLYKQGKYFVDKGKPRPSIRLPGTGGDAIFFEEDTNIASANTRAPSSGPRRNSTSSGNVQNSQDNVSYGTIDYRYETNIPMGANVWKDKLFITVPRRRLGVPSTLNYVPLGSEKRQNVPLIPYPSWDINLYPDTSGSLDNFVSVYRIAIDVCDRMWFVDTGIVETLGNRTIVKPHQLVIINLQNDQILHRFTLPENVLTPATVLASLTVDTPKGSCGDAFAYFPDLAGYGLIVFSLRENRAWRVTHNYFFLEPLAGNFNIAGHSFQWNDGVFSVELSDIKSDGFRDMYFHAMAGTHMYKVSTRILRNQTLATRSFHENDFVVIGDRGPNSQTATADIHKPTGTMFLGLVNQNAVGCWNVNNDLSTLSIVQKNDENMIYPSDVKVSGDKVYVLTNTMPEFLYGRLNYDIINFRVWANDVRSAIEGTKCQNRQSVSY